jgi:arsenate reductase (thioredoxin)
MNQLPLTVLFLSTGNAARGILAEAIMRQKGSHRFTARSAGISPMTHVSAEALSLLASEGISVAGLHSKGFGEFLAAARIVPIHVIVTLSEEARQICPATWPGDPVRVHWTVDDPLASDKADVREWKFRKCLTVLESRINALIKTRVAQNPSELLLQLKDVGMVV